MRIRFLFCSAFLCGVFFIQPFFVFAQNIPDAFVATLRRGSRGNEVARLQEFLQRDRLIYPEGLVTGYFGVLTESAVMRFQKQYGIPRVGIVGPLTRRKLNDLTRFFAPVSAQPLSEETRRESAVSAPLRAVGSAPVSKVVLTPLGIFDWTNRERAQNNLPMFEKNTVLDAIASEKMQDLFLRQYFAHQSPNGMGAGDLAKDAGYDYVNIGENLALGDFESDEALVRAWMDSIGHRANMLGARYTHIGVAVARSMFEGRTTWIAVQIFARPLSACPIPDEEFRASLDEKKKRIDDLSELAEIKKGELSAILQSEVERYNAKVEDYNAVVVVVNALVEEVKAMAEKYNEQVSMFNACVIAPAS
jgi:uncharacterized protein YkwD